MREIKFRAWDIKLNKWVYFHVPIGFPVAMNEDIDFSKLGQFTGLKDKNGKEIYEGDVLHFEAEKINGYQKVIVEENLKVKFNDGAFTTKLELLGNGLRRRPMFVIGNIYENEKLLKSNNQTED